MGKLAARLLLLALCVLPIQLLLGNLLHSEAHYRRDRLDGLVAKGVDVLYLGDSVLACARDGDRRNLPRLLAERLPGRRVDAFDYMAMDLTQFELYLAYLAKGPRRPSDVIVPVNLRSFSPLWDLNPGYELRLDGLRLAWGDTLALGLVDPLAVLGIYARNPRTESEYLASMVWNGERPAGTILELREGSGPASSLSAGARGFILAYATPIAPEHRKLRALRNLIRTCRTSGIRPHLYVTPIDVETGVLRLDPAFRDQTARNVEAIRAAAASEGTEVLDLSAAAAADEFDWSGAPNEHLSQAGRHRVAEALARWILRPRGS